MSRRAGWAGWAGRARAGAVVVLGALLALVIGPRTPHLAADSGGDPDLADRLRTAVDDDRGYQALLVSEITPDGVRHAAIGQTAPGSGRPLRPTDPIELGSVTKTFNGMLLSDAVQRGEVRAGDRLDAHLPELAGSAIGGVTLEELASHRAGVPPLPPGTIRRALLAMVRNGNPYAADTRSSVLAEVRTMGLLATRGRVVYSNLGATLLGWALAAAAGQPEWEQYVEQRLLTPLGMTRTRFAATDEHVPPDAVPGWTAGGRAASRWVSPAFRPAGSSTWTTADDITRYAQAVLRGTAPGMDALTPRFDVADLSFGDSTRIGYHWFVSTVEGRTGVWHDGGTGGFRTMLVIDREQRRAVFVVGNTTRGVEPIAVRILTGITTGPGSTSAPPPVLELLVAVLALALVGGFVRAGYRGRSRVQVIGAAAGAVTGLALARALGPWSYLPGWSWGVLLGLAVVAAVRAARAWPRLGWRAPRWKVLRELSAGLSVLIAATVLIVVR